MFLRSCMLVPSARQVPNVGGLIVESGVMELLRLPMVQQFSMMMPQLLQAQSFRMSL